MTFREAQLEVSKMTMERALRIMAGIMILISVALTQFVSHWWILFTVFIAVNLLQSGFSNWCPGMLILKAAGLRSGEPPCQTKDAGDQS
jgi:hypothetical protein